MDGSVLEREATGGWNPLEWVVSSRLREGHGRRGSKGTGVSQSAAGPLKLDFDMM
jgi:hypothetical protein